MLIDWRELGYLKELLEGLSKIPENLVIILILPAVGALMWKSTDRQGEVAW